ncbi:MAG: hypothetical protein IPJ41_10605 [Phycisphaerales bacterium]|nr:hypothetical protein [Phycisphaerales bacterium]
MQTSNRRVRHSGLILLVIGAAASGASAQWALTDLSPPGAFDPITSGVDGSQQVGQAHPVSSGHAILWTGSAGSWVDLHPAVMYSSYAFAVSGGQQAGFATAIGSPDHAALWTGSAASWVDLNPPGSTQSTAYGVNSGEQVGFARFGQPYHAGIWSGSAASFVDLNPGGPLMASVAYAIGGGEQAGYTRDGGGDYHAALWSGSAASWVDLDPAGSVGSWAWGVDGGQQVGYAVVGGVQRASLWTGSAASWVDLNPAGATTSWAFGVSGGYQAGFADVGGVRRACVWNSSAASWEDLSLSSPGFIETYATSIWTDGNVMYVGGQGLTMDGEGAALLWSRMIPAPGSGAILGLGVWMAARRRRG